MDDDVGSFTIERSAQVVFSTSSPLRRLFVVDEGGLRWLRFDAIDAQDQSAIDLKAPDRVIFEYVRLAGLALGLVDAPRRALVIGLGGGAYPRLLLRHSPQVVVDVVEVDPVVVDVARRFFALPADPRLTVVVDDGAAFVRRAAGPADSDVYDVILLDAFSGTGIPPALLAPAFFANVRRRLSARGVAVLNIAPEDVDAMDDITDRFAAAFGEDGAGCVVVSASGDGNRVVFGAHAGVAVDVVRSAVLRAPTLLGWEAVADVGSIEAWRGRR